LGITMTLESAMAAEASMGESRPKAAIGTPRSKNSGLALTISVNDLPVFPAEC